MLDDRRKDRTQIRLWRASVLIILVCILFMAGWDLILRNATLKDIAGLQREVTTIKTSYTALQKDLADLARLDKRLTQLEGEIDQVKDQAKKKFGK